LRNLTGKTTCGNDGSDGTGLVKYGSGYSPDARHVLLIVHRVPLGSDLGKACFQLGQRLDSVWCESEQLAPLQQLVEILIGKVGNERFSLSGTVQVNVTAEPSAAAGVMTGIAREMMTASAPLRTAMVVVRSSLWTNSIRRPREPVLNSNSAALTVGKLQIEGPSK